LLPALYRALERLGVEHRWLPRLRGVYRYAWAANQLTARDLLALLDAFQQAGLPVVANRGLPLVDRYYADPAGRLVDQVDLLVCPADLDAADRLPGRVGAGGGAAPVDLRSVFSPLTYGRPGHRNVVLHGRSLLAFSPEGRDRELFDRREVGHVQGADVPMLAPLDQLILECVHHRRLAPADHVTWAVDALLVIRYLGPRLPWDEAWARASAMGVAQSFAARIRELRDETGAVLPAWSVPEVPPLSVADHAAASVLLARPSGSSAHSARWWHRPRRPARRLRAPASLHLRAPIRIGASAGRFPAEAPAPPG
jgi:hypothetical protein